MQLRVPRPSGAFTPVPLLQDTNEDFESHIGLAGEGNRPAAEPSATQLRHVASGDPAAFWRLWEEHEKYLYRICLHQLGGVQEEAEDALGVLMVKLLEQLPRYADRIQNLRAWLTRITYNLCIDIRREKWNQHVESIDELTATDSAALLSPGESPEEAALRVESHRHIYCAIADLALKLKLPFLLHHLHDLSYNEVAVRLAISPENARKRGQLARAVLQERLKRYISGTASPSLPTGQTDPDACLQFLWPTERSSIPPRQTAIRLVNVVLSSGVERSFYIDLDHKPLKLHPKIKSVTRYTWSHPSGWKKRLELAQLLYEAGEWREAIDEYQRVLERQPQLLRVYLDMGNMFGLMNNKSDSIATYQKALTIVREPAARHHLKGLIEVRRGDYRSAIMEFQAAAQIEPDHPTHWHNLGMVHKLIDSPQEALGSFEKSLTIDPQDIKALTYLPGLLHALGRVTAATRYVDQALSLQSENLLSIKSLADYRSERRLVFGKEGRKTRSLIKAGLRLATESPEVQESLALFHLCRGEWPEGVGVLRLFAEQHQSCPEAWCYYARALFRTGDLRNAAEAIGRACFLDPDSWKINSLAIEIWSRNGSTAELRVLLERLLENFSERWTAWAKAGWAFVVGLGEAERARVLSAHATQLQPQLADAWFQHSKVLALAGRPAEAITAAQVGWRWLPRDEDGSQSVPAAFGLAENHLFINDSGREQAWIDEGVQRLPGLIAVNPAEGYFWHARLLELSGDKPGALQAFRKSLEQNLFHPLRQDAETAISRLMSPLSKRAGSVTGR